ncbi:MAG: ParB/RepB/Spo0J family partition protein [Acidimicrobiia bacterium]|nr:ParB/RepB/Spo0J family partition protein [Acidimicrobiia bacterium]
MSRQSGLGRGLGALIPSDVTDDAEATFQTVAISSIHANKYQPREHFDEATLDSLTNSVRELGVLQPLLVRKDGEGYELIAGERRWRAAKRAGLQDVPVIVREADDMASLEQALVENLHRQDLNALEEAAAYQQLADDFDLTQAKIAKRVGKSRSAVANTLRLLTLPTAVQRFVSDGRLSAGHARALLGLETEAEQLALAERIVADDLTVRDAERILKGDVTAEPSPDAGEAKAASRPQAGTTRAPAVLELERLLSDRLETTVGVSMGAKKGKISIDYADLDDLERIYRIIAK